MSNENQAIGFLKLKGWKLEEQNKSYLPRQQMVAKFARNNNLRIHCYFNCGGQQISTDKKLGEALRYCINHPKIKYLVVPYISNISQNVADCFTWLSRFERAGVKVVTSELKTIEEQGTPSGKFQISLIVGLAEHYSQAISEATKRGIASKKTTVKG